MPPETGQQRHARIQLASASTRGGIAEQGQTLLVLVCGARCQADVREPIERRRSQRPSKRAMPAKTNLSVPMLPPKPEHVRYRLFGQNAVCNAIPRPEVFGRDRVQVDEKADRADDFCDAGW